jgi:hypothetical protein
VAYFKLEKGIKDLDILAQKIGVSKELIKEPFSKISEDTLLKDSIKLSYSRPESST